MKSQVSVERISFTGGPAWKDNHTVYHFSKDNDVMYLPHPDPVDYNSGSPDAQLAWERLIGGESSRHPIRKSLNNLFKVAIF